MIGRDIVGYFVGGGDFAHNLWRKSWTGVGYGGGDVDSFLDVGLGDDLPRTLVGDLGGVLVGDLVGVLGDPPCTLVGGLGGDLFDDAVGDLPCTLGGDLCHSVGGIRCRIKPRPDCSLCSARELQQ